MKTLTTIIGLLFLSLSLYAQPGPMPDKGMGGPGLMNPDPLRDYFYNPKMIMRFQDELDITKDQRKTLLELVNTATTNSNTIRWDLDEAASEMKDIVGADKVDEKAAMKQLEKVLALENKLKKEQLTLMIGVKNTLTAEQRAKYDEMRDDFRDRRADRRNNAASTQKRRPRGN